MGDSFAVMDSSPYGSEGQYFEFLQFLFGSGLNAHHKKAIEVGLPTSIALNLVIKA